jgi:hypothetical protein
VASIAAHNFGLLSLTDDTQPCRLIKSQYSPQRSTAQSGPFRPAAMEWTCLHWKAETKHRSHHY